MLSSNFEFYFSQFLLTACSLPLVFQVSVSDLVIVNRKKTNRTIYRFSYCHQTEGLCGLSALDVAVAANAVFS